MPLCHNFKVLFLLLSSFPVRLASKANCTVCYWLVWEIALCLFSILCDPRFGQGTVEMQGGSQVNKFGKCEIRRRYNNNSYYIYRYCICVHVRARVWEVCLSLVGGWGDAWVPDRSLVGTYIWLYFNFSYSPFNLLIDDHSRSMSIAIILWCIIMYVHVVTLYLVIKRQREVIMPLWCCLEQLGLDLLPPTVVTTCYNLLH